MNHFSEITESLETQGLDALLLTCEANRFYASGFHSSGTDGIALVTRRHNYYFTDSRYTEAAARSVQNSEIREANRQHHYSALIKADRLRGRVRHRGGLEALHGKAAR